MRKVPAHCRFCLAAGIVAVLVLPWLKREAVPVATAVAPLSKTATVSSASPIKASRPAAHIPGSRTGKPWEDIEGWDRLSAHAKVVALLSQPIGLKVLAQVERLEVARDEWYLPDGKGFTTIPSLPDAEALMRKAEQWQADTGVIPQFVLYPAGQEKSVDGRRILNGRLLLRAGSADDAMAAARAAGCGKVEEIKNLPGYLVAEDRRTPGSSLLSAAVLSRTGGIVQALPLLGGVVKRAAAAYNPQQARFFTDQWHLLHSRWSNGTTSTDIKVTPVWSSFRGSGVVIGIVDDGLQTDHEDISPNYAASFSYDLLANTPSPYPKSYYDCHGTAVAGLAAARGGLGLGVSGASPLASLAAIRCVGEATDQATCAAALALYLDGIDIKNNSWMLAGVSTSNLGMVSDELAEAIKIAATTGRNGKGEILTFAAGNMTYNTGPLQGNKAGLANSIYVVPVGAVTCYGVHAEYSLGGSHLVTCAPSGGTAFGDINLATTTVNIDPVAHPNLQVATYNQLYASGPPPDSDLNTINQDLDLLDSNYTKNMSGTSGSAGIVSGVIALMLEANPDLGWRDVKEILLRSGSKVDDKSKDWLTRNDNPSLPPIQHHPLYGGGMVNATNAVALAQKWKSQNLYLERMSMASATNTTVWTIPDCQPAASKPTSLSIPLDFSESSLRVEQVEVVVDVRHEHRGDLSIDLISPSGASSHLVASDEQDMARNDDGDFREDVYPNYTFTSVRHWGESSTGTWQVKFIDDLPGNVGTVRSVTVKLYGVVTQPVEVVEAPKDVIVPLGSQAALNVNFSGTPPVDCQWYKNNTPLAGKKTSSLLLSPVSLLTKGSYMVRLTNLGRTLDCAAQVGVVDNLPRTVYVNAGSTLNLAAIADGPGIQFQWRRNGDPLVNDGLGGRLVTTLDKQLTIPKVLVTEGGIYTCDVAVGKAVSSTGTFDVRVRVKPQVADFDFKPSIVSGLISLAVPYVHTDPGVDGMPTRFYITGLPPGLTYNPQTGLITGQPNVSGTFTIKVLMYNAAGWSDTVSRTLSVAQLPSGVIGTFNGLIAPDQANGNFGGAFSVVTAANGVFSGRLNLGSAVYPLSGRLTASPSSDPTGKITVLRTSRLPAMNLLFSICGASGHLTGKVQDSVSVEAWRNPFSRTNPATGFAAVYNAWANPPSEAPSTAPQGVGYGVLTVNALGVAGWTGRLADGTVATRVTTINAAGKLPLHFMLYGNIGSAQGWAQPVNQSPGLNTIGGTLRWVKNLNKSTSYPAGFLADGMPLSGGQYVKPSLGTILWGLTNVNPQPGLTNALLRFSNGGIEASETNDVELQSKTVRVLLSHAAYAGQPNPTTLTLAINPATGWFHGTAILKDGTPVVKRSLAFSGMICPGAAKGRGYFLLPQLSTTHVSTTTPATMLSGLVELVGDGS